MRRWSFLTFLLMLFFSGFSYTCSRHFYLGIDFGEGNTHYTAQAVGLIAANVSHQNFMPRLFVGYAFNNQIAAEAGFLQFRDTRLSNMMNALGQTGQNGIILEREFDLSAKLTLQLQQQIYAYGKMGISYLYSRPNFALRTLSLNQYSNYDNDHYRPMIAMGLQYKINSYLALEGSWMSLVRHRTIPRADYISMGVAYSW